MYSYVDFTHFMVMISERRNRQITGRRGTARSGLLEHGNAEKRTVLRCAPAHRMAEPTIFYRRNSTGYRYYPNQHTNR